ncbi:MAG: Gfo/Idh/MocA family oxidoreductase [Planctomycetota bacterium]
MGCGGIVRASHLPAYRANGLEVAFAHDADRSRAEELVRDHGVAEVLDDLAAAPEDAIFDVAVPPDALPGVVGALPRGAFALLQKPMGVDLAGADLVLATCRERGITAAVNFQLRFSALARELRALVRAGALGSVTEVRVTVDVHTPWELWPFLVGMPRMELCMHSIHYLDLLRDLLGEPRGVVARTWPHPGAPGIHSTRTVAILDHGDALRCVVSTNHSHRYGRRHQRSEIAIEGDAGAAIGKMGVNLDYPRGEPDTLEVSDGTTWREVELDGSWFPDAFAGPMCNLQRFAAGEDDVLVTRVEDAWRTMAVVEACYTDARTSSTAIPTLGDGDAS